MGSHFAEFDFDQFWEDSDYADQEYNGAPLTADIVASVERELGYKLPESYIEFMKQQNGGVPKRTIHRTKTPSSGDYIQISGLFAIGSQNRSSLCGEFGNRLWLDEWGYPPIGIYFADCPSGGHDMICFDYRACGPAGEPCVVHVDQGRDFEITPVALNFEAFIRGLEEEVEDESEEA